ncbi:MAG: alpha/beta hydrolase family protein, partial [Candidatus Aminicenantales bacterium]
LDPHYSEPIDHPWCTIRKVAFQLWPGVYSRGLLIVPKELREKPAPAVLCTHGHTHNGYADADEQKRYLMFARLGYVTFVTPQDHHEDLLRGWSHQTYMVWNNMRGLDFLESLSEVDPNRIGVNGLSGGGLQAQMLLALDPRVKAATIGGITTDYREILFTYGNHCECNHFPGIMTYTDQPEISALGFPTPVQFLTMDDWTLHFPADNFPTIRMIYRDNGYPDRAECDYWPTPHEYDRAKRERTYWWMEKWVRGDARAAIPSEPEEIRIVFPPKALLGLPVTVPGERTYEEFRRAVFHRDDRIAQGVAGWKDYRTRMMRALGELLGEAQALPPEGEISSRTIQPAWAAGARVEEILVPSEGASLVAAIVISPAGNAAPRAVEVVLAEAGRAAAAKDPERYLTLVRQGNMVVLPDLRFSGEYGVKRLAGRLGPGLLKFKMAYPLGLAEKTAEQASDLAGAWDRNGIMWGRPVPGMMAGDLRAVIDALARRPGMAGVEFRVSAEDTSALAVAALFAACLDPRIAAVDADFRGHRFEKTPFWRDDLTALPLVSRVLLYGDIPQWALLLADRRLTLRNVPLTTGDRRSLDEAFARLGNRKNLKLTD